jgi:miniconductance mechanosensitive channel
VSFLIVKFIAFRIISRIVNRTKNIYDDILLNKKILRRVAYIGPVVVFHEFAYLIPDLNRFFQTTSAILIVLIIMFIVGGSVVAINEIHEKKSDKHERPIKGYLQLIKIIAYIIGGITIIGILTQQNPWTLVTGLAAASALILLIFRDTILSFVTSIQINSYDLVRKGDWIEIPKYGTDGDVIDISLNVIKVQNWDKTISVLPTYKLIEDSFKNWRGMQQTGGRRIKRSINIDLGSVKFCDEEMINRFKKYQLISDYLETRLNEIKMDNQKNDVDESELINGRRLTNIGTFREYVKAYLRKRDDVVNNLTFLVRHLDPGPTGIPIEIYVFANTTEWAKYEEIQASIFDHVLSVVPMFDLRIFQNPSGNDFKELAS